MHAEEIPAEPDDMKEQVVVTPFTSYAPYMHILCPMFQLFSSIPENSISSNSSQGTTAIGHLRETTSQSGALGSGGDCPLYPSNVYAPQAQAFYYRG